MLAAAARPFAALEAHRTALADRLSALPRDVTAAAPAPDAWSLAQIVDHLVRIDATLQPAGRDGSAWERATSPARAGIVRAVLALPVRVRAPPSAPGILPGAAPDLAERLGAWAAIRASWGEVLEGAAPADLDRFVVLHPLAGRFRWPDALAFLLTHHRHHDRQVARTLAAVA